ncbi:MAG: tRNA uridine-5-carboxymethylaminomethyl(34) synthesis enzyme MnmG [Geobacteraceae bacterium]
MVVYEKQFDILVVGAGHAGCEAALAGARMGCSTLLFSINLDAIALMSCNPAIGGLAKGHLVREIDALGGEMGKNIDATGIQFRTLNTRKGPAVRASRAQADKQQYRMRMKQVLEHTENLSLKQGEVTALYVKDGVVLGVDTQVGVRYLAKTVILTTGTFLRGLIHVGLTSYAGGRAGDLPAMGLSTSLATHGFELGRLKTGTPARLDARTIDFSKLEPQFGDEPPIPFSFSTEHIDRPQLPCHIAYTNERTHDIIRANLDRSPLYGGLIEGVGPRYCPSIEDKVVRFPDKIRHQSFIEPEGRDTIEMYPSGLSTSLPIDVQIALYRSIEGLESVEIMRPAYAIEYDYVDPIQIHASLETKRVQNLYHAGQINGTSGYEEAAAQGLMAGINAALRVRGIEPLVLGRGEAYIGVLIDDLVTMGTKEPYRMFTSRAEYRLLLREDNADQRLREKGYAVGLVREEEYRAFKEKVEMIEVELCRLRETRVVPAEIDDDFLQKHNLRGLQNAVTYEQLMRRPEFNYQELQCIDKLGKSITPVVREQVEIQIKYQGYIDRQRQQISSGEKLESTKIPVNFDYTAVSGFSIEAREKLMRFRPDTLGQASRISGITPAAISILAIALKSGKGK